MTQASSSWDGIVLGDATNAPYSSNEWAHLWAQLNGVGSLFPNYGVLSGTGDGTYDPLQPIASGASNVDVKVGAALVNGKLYETNAAVTLTVGANVSGNPRIDTVVLRADYVGQTVRPAILQGTPAVSPVRPTLTQNATTWEMPLADVAAANGFATITQADITDRRRFTHSTGAGWQPFAYPIGTNPADDHTSTISITANQAIAVPIQIAGNMLLDRLKILSASNVNSAIDWGLYIEDVNDGDDTYTTVRRVGGRVSGGATTAFTSATMIAIPATPPPIPLVPGVYWLAFKTSQNLQIGAKVTAAGGFNSGVASYMDNTAPGTLGQTLDFDPAAGWVANTTNDASLAIRLEGRIADQITAF